MFNSSPSLADIAAVTGGNRNDGAWGDGGWWVLIILFALFGGWGGYGLKEQLSDYPLFLMGDRKSTRLNSSHNA